MDRATKQVEAYEKDDMSIWRDLEQKLSDFVQEEEELKFWIESSYWIIQSYRVSKVTQNANLPRSLSIK